MFSEIGDILLWRLKPQQVRKLLVSHLCIFLILLAKVWTHRHRRSKRMGEKKWQF